MTLDFGRRRPNLLGLIYRDIISGFASSKGQLAYYLIAPILYIFVVGYGYLGIVSPIEIGGTAVNYVVFVAPGIITVQIMNVALQAGMTLFLDRQTGMFEQILVCPFSRRDYVISKVASIIVQGLASGLFVLFIGIPVLIESFGSLLILENVVFVLVALTTTAVLFGALMLVVVTFVRSVQKFNILFNTLYLPIMFLSSAFYPLQSAPSLLATVASLNPLTFSTDLLRGGLLGLRTGSEPFELLASVVASIVALLLAFVAFRRVTVEE